MDLVASIRKEGSRGGRDSFKWTDVASSTHRENYLGHSLMAPVGRWQKNKDLGWYAKGDSSTEADAAAKERAEEIRRIKEAEQDALSRALGLPVADRTNANLEPLGGKDVEKMLKEAAGEDGDEDGEGGKGVGFGNYAGGGANATANGGSDERSRAEKRKLAKDWQRIGMNAHGVEKGIDDIEVAVGAASEDEETMTGVTGGHQSDITTRNADHGQGAGRGRGGRATSTRRIADGIEAVRPTDIVNLIEVRDEMETTTDGVRVTAVMIGRCYDTLLHK